MWFLFGAIAAAVVAILVFTLMSTVTRTENYYVLNEDVPARTQITEDLLQEVTVSAGSVPSNALSLGELLGGETPKYTLYPLKANDVLTDTNVGELLPLTRGLPDDFVVGSFSAKPNNSAAGNIKRGDYIDIIAIADGDDAAGEGITASYILQHVLVIDATIDLDTYDGASDSGSSEDTGTSATSAVPSSQTGAIPVLYTVGLTQENALRLAVASKYDLFVVLSSRAAIDGDINENIGRISSANIWEDFAPDAGKNTDNTFGSSEDAPVRPGGGSDEPSAPSTETEEPSAPSTETEEPSSPDGGGTTEEETTPEEEGLEG
jgi:Flp pilus assembly protein CpaB